MLSCAWCGKSTSCPHGDDCPPVIDVEKRHFNVKPCARVCGPCLTPKEFFHDRPMKNIRVSVLEKEVKHVNIPPPGPDWRCKNPKHQKPIRRKGQIVGTKGRIHFSHTNSPCPSCDPRVAWSDGTRITTLEQPTASPPYRLQIEMPCLRCGGSGVIW